jgi:hypothetical protein
LYWQLGVIEILAGNRVAGSVNHKNNGHFINCIFCIDITGKHLCNIKKVNPEKADNSGNGINYLWFRIPEQVFFMAWVYFFAVG